MIIALRADFIQLLELAFRDRLLTARALEHVFLFFRRIIVEPLCDGFKEIF